MKKHLFLLMAFVFLAGCRQQYEDTKPIRKDVTETVFASGKLAAKGTYNLIARSDGYLVKINFEAGDIVTTGAVLAVVNNETSMINTTGNQELFEIAEYNAQQHSPALSQAKSAIEIAHQQLDQDSLQAARYETLWKQNSVSQVDYENAQLKYKTSRKNLESAIETFQQLEIETKQQLIHSRMNYEVSSQSLKEVEIRAVVAGKVYEKHKEVGDYVTRGTVIATIGHPSDLYAEVQIDESAIASVTVGQKAVVQLNTRPQETLNAVVSEIMPTFDEASQSFTVKLAFTEPLDFYIIGTQLQSNIIVDQVSNALLIPRKYLDYNGYVQLKSGPKVPVTTKTVSNDWVHVLEGIDDDTELTVAVN